MVLVSLLVKTHSRDIVQGLQDVIPEQGDLQILARNGAFLTSKLLLFGVFPQIYEYLCASCASGHDTVTIVIPDVDVEVVRDAFEKLFNGELKELSEIIGIENDLFSFQKRQKNTSKETSCFIKTETGEIENDTISEEDLAHTNTTKNKSSMSIAENDDRFVAMEDSFSNNATLKVQKISIEESDSVFPCVECDKTFDTRRKVFRHIREVHKVRSSKLTFVCDSENFGAVYTNKRDLKYCKCKTKKRNRQPKDANDPWNICCYKCEMCEKFFVEKNTLRKHVVNNRQMDYLSEYVIAFGDPDVSNPKWSCELCTTDVKYERRSISCHLVEHSLDIVQYGELYGVPGQGDKTET